MDQKEIVEMLKLVAELLERSDPSEVRRLLNGKTRLVIEKSQLAVKIGSKAPTTDIQWDKAKGRLAAAHSKTEGRQILTEEGIDKRKHYLEHFAKLCSVPVRRSESMNALADRVVNAVAGPRLYSEMVKRTHLRGLKEAGYLDTADQMPNLRESEKS